MLKQCYESKTNIYLRFYGVISLFFTFKSCFLTAAILPDKKTGASVGFRRRHVQKTIGSTLYSTESNLKNRENSAMGMKIGGEGHFDMLKKIGCEPNSKVLPEAIFRQWGYVGASP